MLTDRSGNIVWQNDFTPFGEETGESGFLERDGFYTGKKIDSDTDLYYFNARWYDPGLGRFITEDPIKDGVNWYSYVSNRPLTMIDPTGLRATDSDQEEENKSTDKTRPEELRKSQERTRERDNNTPSLEDISNLSMEDLKKLQESMKGLQEGLKNALEGYGHDIEKFMSEFDMDFIYDILGDTYSSIGLPVPDGLVALSISEAMFSGEGLGFGGGLELVHTQGYGWSVFGQLGGGAGIPNTSGIAIEAGVIWGMNGDPKSYRGGFIEVQGNLKALSGSAAFWPWGTSKGMKMGASFGSNLGLGFLVEGYTRIYDQHEGAMPDMLEYWDNYKNFYNKTSDGIKNWIGGN